MKNGVHNVLSDQLLKLKFEKLEPVSVGHLDLEITPTTNEPWKWLLIHFSSGKLVMQF